jgi:hypothetical protein
MSSVWLLTGCLWLQLEQCNSRGSPMLCPTRPFCCCFCQQTHEVCHRLAVDEHRLHVADNAAAPVRPCMSASTSMPVHPCPHACPRTTPPPLPPCLSVFTVVTCRPMQACRWLVAQTASSQPAGSTHTLRHGHTRPMAMSQYTTNTAALCECGLWVGRAEA